MATQLSGDRTTGQEVIFSHHLCRKGDANHIANDTGMARSENKRRRDSCAPEARIKILTLAKLDKKDNYNGETEEEEKEIFVLIGMPDNERS